MQKISLYLILVLVCCSCNSKTNNKVIEDTVSELDTVLSTNVEDNIEEKDCNNSNTFIYKDNIEITLPPKFYIKHSIIYNDKDEKIGEFSPGLITPLQNISFPEILDLYKERDGEIEAKETTYSFYGAEELPDIMRIDSIELKNYKWYFIVEKTIYETGDNWGFWNEYKFITFYKDKILFINFYDMEIEKDKSNYFIAIVETVKIITKNK